MIDVDEIEAGERSPLYLALIEKYKVMLRQKTNELIAPEDPKKPENTASLRGYIAAINDIAGLPAMLKAEIATRRKQNARRAR